MEKTTSANQSSGYGCTPLNRLQDQIHKMCFLDFINPAKSLSELSSISVLPNRPSPEDILQIANFISDLSGTKVEDYKIRLSQWKETKTEIYDIRRVMGLVQNKVHESISERLLPQLRGKSNVLPNDKTIISWLDEWELVYADAKEQHLPHIMDLQAQYDFLYSVESIAGAWTELKLAMIDEQASSGENFIDFYDLLEVFRHKQRLIVAFNKNTTNSIGGSNSSGVFTVGGSKQDTTHKDRDNKGVKNCLCGMKHKFDDCFYLNFKNTTRPHKFKYKKEVFDKINGKLKAAYMGKVRAYITNKLDYDPKVTPSAALKSNEEGDVN
ncbi:hypothetical protein OnM2_045031 [Erysiphe neolycopersici]|uniref:Uncharacterized protein n=1 Tax=Erysiphe neolycopersici TaxID=212602 RepID=A0A420HUC3_9PEZI|nr:hypothetical protein OnM2_045031 [Erysiphe neolycopersici]